MRDERLALLQLGIAKSRAIEAAQRGRDKKVCDREVRVARTRAWKAAVAGDIGVRRAARRVW